MKRLILALVTGLIAGSANIAWGGLLDIHSYTGKIDPVQNWKIQAGIPRDAANGVWDIASAVAPYTVSYIKSDGTLRLFWNIGAFAAKNINQKSDYYGPFMGPIIYNLNLNPAIDLVSNMAGASWKPSSLISLSTSLNGMVGYCPNPSGDLKKQFPYGFMFLLNGSFSTSDIVKIVTNGL